MFAVAVAVSLVAFVVVVFPYCCFGRVGGWVVVVYVCLSVLYLCVYSINT